MKTCQPLSETLSDSHPVAGRSTLDRRPPGRTLRFTVSLAAFLALAACSGDPGAEPEENGTPAADAVPERDERPADRAPVMDIVELESGEAVRAAEEIQNEVSLDLMEGFEATLWASEELLGDPVGLDVDEYGRVFVTSTRRHQEAEFDIRGHTDWMIPSITWETVEDRRAFLREELSPERSDENRWLADRNGDGSHDWRDLTELKDRVFRIEDTSGDGLADRGQVFYEGFNEEVSDVAAGVLVRGSDVYVTSAPDLWRLRDTTGDGWADEVESMVHGFGVHIGFSGHGLSGPIVGPDGRIYWAIGDYGANVVDRDGRRWEYPNTGVIVRAEPDGSDFEVYASGLRNPHEFAFDEYGNLITVDNDGDHGGEHERIVYVFDGSDSGWRTNWQFGKYGDPDNNEYKVWMDEEMFRPHFEGQAAHMLPPVAAFRSGPSGLAYNPGTAFTEEWRNFVFVSQFVGNPPRSGVTAFRLEENGAFFELAEQHDVLSGIAVTSMAFGPEGALYLADWVDGWAVTGTGRIWKLDTPETAGSDLRAETQAYLVEDFGGRSDDELLELLGHPDARVRSKAQFALVDRGSEGAETLLAAVRESEHRLPRIHGLWGLGQVIRAGGDRGPGVAEFLTDDDPEIRAQAARVLGDVRYAPAAEFLTARLQDSAARVRFFATEALGRIGHEPAVEAIAQMLVDNNDEDLALRHAGVIALARIGRAEPLTDYANHESRALRIASVVALRRMEHPGVAAYLSDPDERIATDAARAINDDRSIPEALPALARVLDGPRFTNEPFLRRAINANLRVGDAEAARRVAAYAADPDAPEAMRVEALAALGVWPRPSILDRVTGRHRGAVERDPAIAREAVSESMDTLLTDETSPAVRTAALEAADSLSVRSAAPAILAVVRDDESAAVRAAALEALHGLGSELLADAVARGLDDSDGDVRSVALRLAPSLDAGGPELVEMLAGVVEGGSVREQQAALAALGRLRNEEARNALGGWLEELAKGNIAPEIQLELIEAVEASEDDALLATLEAYRNGKSEGDAVAAYSETLYGGSVSSGRQIFRGHPGVSCTRCHAVRGRGGDAGPDLTEVGARATRQELLRALVDPSAEIAPGYGIVTLTLENGERVIGTLREETDTHYEMDVGGEIRRIERGDVAERSDAPSSMPAVGPVLTKREIRDLLEYLANLE